MVGTVGIVRALSYGWNAVGGTGGGPAVGRESRPRVQESLRGSGGPLPGTAVQDDGLHIGHLGDRRAGAFLADAAALQSAVGHQVGAPQRGPVDMDGAGVYLPDGPHRTRDVRGEDPGAQSVGGAVA